MLAFLTKWPSSRYLVLVSTDSRNNYLEQILSLELSETRELFELEMNAIDRTHLEQWASNIQSDDIEIITESELPPRLRDDYYDMIIELLGNVEHKSKLFDDGALSPEKIQLHHKSYQEKGIRYLALLMLKKGALIGYTEILIKPNEPELAHQSMTGIKKGYRGSGLGKYLKALMIQRLLNEHPEISTVKTAIHIKNLPSQQLNRQLGFQKIGDYKEYLIPRKSMLKYAKERGLPIT